MISSYYYIIIAIHAYSKLLYIPIKCMQIIIITINHIFLFKYIHGRHQ